MRTRVVRGRGLPVALALVLLAAFVSGRHGRGVAAAGDPVVVAVGDIACGSADAGNTKLACQYKATSDLAVAANPDAFLALGDNQYECGTLSDYTSYYDATWGRLKSQTYPVPGNHEYATNNFCQGDPTGAPGYYSYFGSASTPLDPGCTVSCRGYYSFDLGAWHIIALNSNCGPIGGCAAGSPEETWLQSDLAAHQGACILAYWHHPLYTSVTGPLGPNTFMRPIWQDLYAAHVSVVLNGHDHLYERFAPQDPNGGLDQAAGIREFVVGTGGRDFTGFPSTLAPNSVAHDNNTFGVLEMTLHPTGYDWRFVPASVPGYGSFADSGSATCVGAASATSTPTATATSTVTTTPTDTPTSTPTATPTGTTTAATPGDTPTATGTPTSTPVPTAYPTFTGFATPTDTPVPPPTDTPTATPTDTPLPVATAAPSPSPTHPAAPASFRLNAVRVQWSDRAQWHGKVPTVQTARVGSRLSLSVYVTITRLPTSARLKVVWTVSGGKSAVARHASHVDLGAGRTGRYYLRWLYSFGRAGPYLIRTDVSLQGKVQREYLRLSIHR